MSTFLTQVRAVEVLGVNFSILKLDYWCRLLYTQVGAVGEVGVKLSILKLVQLE